MTTTGISAPPSLAGWQARTLHTVTCDSGQRLRIRIPGIATLLEHGELPDDLVALALAEVTRPNGAAEQVATQVNETEEQERKLALLSEFGAFQRHLACAAIAEVENDGIWHQVKLSPEDLDSLPEDDVAMVALIVQRLRNTDARGVTIGVEPIDRWRRFHEEHGLDPENCGSCKAFLGGLSTADVG